MKIRKDFEVKNISGQNTIIYQGKENINFVNTIVLNESALFLFNLLKTKDTSKREMLNELLDNFDISTVLALGDIDIFIRTLKENGVIEQ